MIGCVVDPVSDTMHQSSLDKMRSFRNKYLSGKETQPLVILDLGSQNIGGCYRDIFDSPQWHYQGLDLVPGENVDVVLKEPYNWQEIPSLSADVLISGQAFEHIKFFWLTMGEIARVLKPGGLCCIVAPSSGFEHRYPVDCWRFYPDGFAALACYAKLDVVEVFTQWNEDRYTDGSNEWKDSVLIAQKPTTQLTSKKRKSVVQKFVPPPASGLFKHYPELQSTDQTDLEENSSHKKQLRLIGNNKRVIDFGCARGSVAQLLKQQECYVTGVELNPDAAKAAEQHCDHVLVADLDSVSLSELLPGQQFDVAVFGDVLEHLREPWRILREVHHILKPGGYVVASIPNIAHGAIRLALLQGQFEYTEFGILDSAHLRFFAYETIESLFEQTGYFLETIDRTKELIFSNSFEFPKVNRQDFDHHLISQIELSPEAETVRFVVKAVPVSWEVKYAALQTENESLLQQLEETQVGLRQLQQEHAHRWSQLEQMQTQVQQNRAALESTQTELRNKLQQSQTTLEAAETTIAAMKSSKVWKLRETWTQFKRLFSL